MAYRMMKVPPSQENGRKEENDIFKIAKKNNFGEEAIRQIIDQRFLLSRRPLTARRPKGAACFECLK
ncbi:unnamed protein product [Bemisia tabaci]|uniref:Uncharacterized protein n=1 Tax=Bemisia tabaci TaxID=7038 RepID=A0A9P0AMG3_BEMTA|nr:unnamed protein product [Bemisia tabaci]